MTKHEVIETAPRDRAAGPVEYNPIVAAPRRASRAVGEFRIMIRDRPLAMAALLLGLGYVVGRLFGVSRGPAG